MRRNPSCGFTLIELMVVIAIVGIAMTIAVPGIKELLNNQKMRSATFDLVTSVMFARSEAVKFGSAANASITIKAISDEFENGWCIIYKSSAGADCNLDTPGATVMQVNAPVSGVNYTWKTTGGILVYGRNGRLSASLSSAEIPAQIEVSDSQGYAATRCVVIDPAGNANVSLGACT